MALIVVLIVVPAYRYRPVDIIGNADLATQRTTLSSASYSTTSVIFRNPPHPHPNTSGNRLFYSLRPR